MSTLHSLKSTVLGVSLAVVTGLALLPDTAAADDVITWRLQTHNPRASWTYEHDTVALAEKVKERTNGRLQIQVYEAGTLFSATEIFAAVQRGIIPMGTVTPGYILNRSELAAIAFGLPGSFENVWEAAHFFFNTGFEQAFREDLLTKHGVYWATSVFFPTEVVLKKPVESMDQFRSTKIRSSGSLQKFLTDAGASAPMIAGEEIYQALSSGVVDGAHWGAVTGAASLNLYEVAKYHVKPSISVAANGFIINKKAMDSLPPDIRAILVQTLNEHVWQTTAHNEIGETALLRQMQEKQGVQVVEFPPEVRSALRKAALKSWEEEAKKGSKAAQQIEKMKELLTELGHI